MNNFTVNEYKTEETLDNVYHPNDRKDFWEHITSAEKIFLVFLFDSSMDFSFGYFKVINILAKDYPEVQFVSMDFINDYKIGNPFDGHNNSKSLYIKTFHKGKFTNEVVYVNFTTFIRYHIKIDGLDKLKCGKLNVSKDFDDTKPNFDKCNFVFASNAKEALSYINTKPAVLAFVYDKDDKEYICSEDVLFNFLHDLSLYSRDVTILLVEKTVSNTSEFPNNYHYKQNPIVLLFKETKKLHKLPLASFEKTMRSISLDEIGLSAEPLKQLYRGNLLFYHYFKQHEI